MLPPLIRPATVLLLGCGLCLNAVLAQPAPPPPPGPPPAALPGGSTDAEPRLRPGRPPPPPRPSAPAPRPPGAPPPALAPAFPPPALAPAPPPRPIPQPPPRWRPAPPWPAVTVVPSWRMWPYYDPFGVPVVPYRYSPYPYPYYPAAPWGPSPAYGSTVVIPPASWSGLPPVQWVERPPQTDPAGEQGGSPLPGYWYWCADPPGWFPEVRECVGGFEPVAPQAEGSAP